MNTLFKLFWIILFSITANVAVLAQTQPCGNDAPKGPSGPPDDDDTSDDPFKAYTGNDYREIKDLEIWGGVGEHQLAWKRHGTSRFPGTAKQYFGTAHNWRHEYQWEVYNYPNDPSGAARKQFVYPDGTVNNFTQVSSTEWRSTDSITDIVFQNGSNFIMQRKNGWRYYFNLHTYASNGQQYYTMDQFEDSQGNIYQVQHDTSKRVAKVIEPGGRWFKINYVSLPVDKVEWVTLGTITSPAADGQWTSLTIGNSTPYRFFRYIGADRMFGTVAELEFLDTSLTNKLVGTAIGGGPEAAVGTEFDKATDNNTSSYFESADQTGAFAGIDLGIGNTSAVGKVRVFPKAGSQNRLVGGKIQGALHVPSTISVISSVETFDGRRVDYDYQAFNDPNIPYVYQCLKAARYGDLTQATYTYGQALASTRPLLTSAVDPRYERPFVKIKNEYFTGVSATLGQIRYQKNYVTGEVLAELGALTSKQPTITYPNGGKDVFTLPEGQVTVSKDALGKLTSYVLDQGAGKTGFRVQITDALGH
jgi:hypothetical protein